MVGLPGASRVWRGIALALVRATDEIPKKAIESVRLSPIVRRMILYNTKRYGRVSEKYVETLRSQDSRACDP